MMEQKPSTVENWITLGFSAFGLLGILQHEMWRDEMQAWLLARDSSNILELIQFMEFEGHPALWHFLLYGLNHITHNVFGVQILHLLISIVMVWLVIKFSPFSILHKFLLSFSYFIFFEYTFISRNYNLGILFLFLFCITYRLPKKRYVLLSILLILAANTNVYAFIIGIALALFAAVDILQQKSMGKALNSIISRSQLTSSLTILALGWLLSTLQIVRVIIPKIIERLSLNAIPQPSIDPLLIASISTTTIATESISPEVTSYDPILSLVIRAGNAIADIWESYVPIPLLFKLHFWNTNILTQNEALPSLFGIFTGELLGMGLAIALIGISTYLFACDLPVLCLYIAGNAMMLMFQVALHDTPYIRHTGHFFILFIVSFWLFNSRFSKPQNRSEEPLGRLSSASFIKSLSSFLQHRFLTIILTIQFLVGIYAAGIDYLFTFSGGKAAANYIQANNLSEIDIFGSRYRQAAVLSGYLDTPIYYPEYEEFGSFWTNLAPEIQNEAELLQKIKDQIDVTENKTLVLALTIPLTSDLASEDLVDISIEELARFEESIVANETFYLYLAKGT